MDEEKKPKGFQKGNNLGKGRPPLTDAEKLLRGDGKKQFAEVLAMTLNLKRSQFEAMLKMDLTGVQHTLIAWLIQRQKNPTNDDIRMIASFFGYNLNTAKIDHVSTDGSHNLSNLVVEFVKPKDE